MDRTEPHARVPSAPTSPPFGAIFLRAEPDDEVLLRLCPGESRVLEGVRLSHEGDRVTLARVEAGAVLRVFGATVPEASLAPPCMVELGALRGMLVSAPRLEAEERELPAPLPGLVGASRPMLALSRQVRRFALVGLPLLLRGESGTGKDLVARAAHELGPRRKGPFVAINAATISRDLAESELFGHVRGAFTGAVAERRGAFREAHGGTLLIDEIAALGADVQAKLLRVVEDGMVRPLGGEGRHAVDVRLVVATCEPLEQMVEAGRFREDLYERLAVCVVAVPPLHERPEDIPALAAHLLRANGLERVLPPATLHLLMSRRYRGNVRELRNVLAQAALRAAGRVLDAEHVVEVLEARAAARRRVSPVEAAHWLEACEGNVSAAARRARLPRSTLRDLLRRGQDEDTVASKMHYGRHPSTSPRVSA